MAGRFSFLPAALLQKRPCQATTSFFIPFRWSTSYVIHPIPTMQVSISRPQRRSTWLLEMAHPPKHLMMRVVVDGQLEPVHQLRWFLRPFLLSTRWLNFCFWGLKPSPPPTYYPPNYLLNCAPIYLPSHHRSTYLLTHPSIYVPSNTPIHLTTNSSNYLCT
jgi:hypothetical protein